jgi:hypothetical protein
MMCPVYPYTLDGICSTTVYMFAYFYFGSWQGANWDPEGRVALVSFSNSTTLGSIHFSSKPPCLGIYRYPCKFFFFAKTMLLYYLSCVPFLQMLISYQLNFQKFPPWLSGTNIDIRISSWSYVHLMLHNFAILHPHLRLWYFNCLICY